MASGGTRRFGLGLVRFQQVAFALGALALVLSAVGSWRAAGGPDGWVVLASVLALVCVLTAVAVQGQVVRVGDGRISWRFGAQRHELAFDEVAEIRKDPRWWTASSELVTTDGRALPLPLRPGDGPEAWRLVLGDRAPSAA